MTGFDHDGSLRSVFSEPRAVRDLARGFLDSDVYAQLDWSTLKQMVGRHTTGNLKQSDMIWEIGMLGDPGRVMFLQLEFQSQPDWTMALRMLNYFGQLHATLAKRDAFKAERQLPEVRPIVVYDGEREWTAARSLAELLEADPQDSEGAGPQLRHELVDVFRSPELDRSLQNVADAMFRLHRAESLEAARAEVRWIKGWLSDEDSASLRRTMVAWIVITLAPSRLSGTSVRVARGLREWDELEAAMATWSEQLKAEGRAEGKAGLLVSMARQRFGEAVASTMSALLGSVQTESALDEVGAWLLTCETGDALIARIRQI